MYLLFIVVVVIYLLLKYYFQFEERQIRRAGKRGEHYAENVLIHLMNKDDYLLSNIEISYNNKKTELDKIIINSHGVFIVEVKNYSGNIFGNEDDDNWQKYKTIDTGNTYLKTVSNPIKQVNRQVWILKNYLLEFGIRVWIEGYVYMINANSPFKSEILLDNINDVDKAIHGTKENVLSQIEIKRIIKLLEYNK